MPVTVMITQDGRLHKQNCAKCLMQIISLNFRTLSLTNPHSCTQDCVCLCMETYTEWSKSHCVCVWCVCGVCGVFVVCVYVVCLCLCDVCVVGGLRVVYVVCVFVWCV